MLGPGTSAAATILEVLEAHACRKPQATAYRLLADGEREAEVRSFQQLAMRARRIAGWLAAHGLRHRQVLIAIRHELNFLEALLGCLYASCVAVPVSVPRREAEVALVKSIADNSCASVLLLSRCEQQLHVPLAAISSSVPAMFLEDGLGWERAASADESLRPTATELALLQYTSGSTGAPKGVQITHDNLLQNEIAIQAAMNLGEATVFVSWLPLFHDMGLIGGALQPLFLGVTCVLLPATAFLMKPVRWLNAIHRYRGTTSGAPNFAFDLCVNKTTPQQRAALDLSSWTVAFNGSEPVRSSTLERFTAAFAGSGFQRRSFYPCYGMAEATLMIAGPQAGSEPVTRKMSCALGTAQECGVATSEDSMVACGRPVRGTTVVIVNPEAGEALPERQVGEIWISGPGVTSGYFDSSVATQAARVADGKFTGYLRTGDLGCIIDGELFVVGRLKDLVIVRGRKHHPQDLEYTAASCSSLLAAGGGAAFAVDVEGSESLVIVHELTRQGWLCADAEELSADIREALIARHGIAPSQVVLIRPGSLPRTTSGKVRRAHCRQLFRDSRFELLEPASLA